MGFIEFAPAPVDVADWKRRPHLERIKPLAQDWAVNGFGTPTVVYLLYVVKLAIFAVGGIALIGATTPGLGGLGDFGDWWTEPIVWQKVVVFAILWEFLGLGSSSGPLTFRFLPPIGGPLYWLRPGCIRLPPFPRQVPFTRGTSRTPLDVLLALAIYATLAWLLFSGGTAVGDAEAASIFQGAEAGKLDATALGLLVGLTLLLGLRDKVAFLQMRPDIHLPLLIIFLFPISAMVVASQLALFFVWFGAATSKLTHHFTYVVQVMTSNTPWNRSQKLKRQLYADHPDSLRPSRAAHLLAHFGTALEFAFPIALLLTQGGTLGWIAVAVGLVFHIQITSTFPLAVPLEWNVLMMFGLVWLFGEYGAVPFSTLDEPLLIATLLILGLGIPVLGRLRPQNFSFLWAMLYYAGNWATSWWLFDKRRGIEERVDDEVTKSSKLPVTQLARLYDRDFAELVMYKALSFRSLHSHGRALNGLLPRLVANVDAYHVREGELIAGALLGWNFGDAHFHNEQLLEAVQGRLGLEAGDLRVVTLESQAMLRSRRQRYRLLDAKTGLIEEGWVHVREMCRREPWLDESGTIPVEVEYAAAGADAPATRSATEAAAV